MNNNNVPTISSNMPAPSTPVSEFYQNRSVFVTGGTGFMGKVLVEKLLRSCPGIKNIYLLMRPKHGQDINGRLAEIINAPVRFSNLYK
jgi:Putative dehydrogenase domain of multifunctional non-ribosomal peptide synthetases and related enzymes